MFNEFYSILLFIIISGLIGVFITIATNFLGQKGTVELEKVSPYECGFNPFEDARETFDVRFYLIGILFLIFDLEIAFLFPWALSINSLSEIHSVISYCSVFFFLLILTIGFIYEWAEGALDN